ncbi:hypothetical protein BJ742DRAFT_823392, partial [Cladochytrium replicatum]
MKLAGHSNRVHSVAWSHSGTKILSGAHDDTVKVWSATTGEQLTKFAGHSGSALSVARSHDWTKFVSQSFREKFVWSTVTGRKLDRESLSDQDHRGGNYDLLFQLDSDGWVVWGHHKFWLSAEMRGRIYHNGENGVCVVRGSKIFCFL